MTDYCGGCGERLRVAEHSARLRCCSDKYWTPHAPTQTDRARYEVMNGFPMCVQMACVDPGDLSGKIVRHAPLYLHGGFFLGS